MAAPSENFRALPNGQSIVAYKDPSGGLNTKRDAHALERNMLAVSINGWPAYDNVVAKRPGSNFAVSLTGATGNGGVGTHIVATRWVIAGVSTTVWLAQNGQKLAFAAVTSGSWTLISTLMGVGAQRIHVAQMYDPLSAKNQCFICNGVDLPWMWAGPGNTTLTQTSVVNGLPVNFGGVTGITPRFVITTLSSLCYAGEPTAPTAVYLSNPWFPQAFTQGATAVTGFYPGSFSPELVGFNDGINGGSITGLANLQGLLLIFKESAIYRGQFVNTYGTAYALSIQNVSAQRGCTGPETIAAYDSYVAFLSIDGVYYTDGWQIYQVSGDVPTFFDGSLNGLGPICLSYTSAVAVRSGSRYLIWYDRGIPSAPGTPIGYPTSGLWFDFSKQTVTGLPQAGELQGVTSLAGTSWAICGAASANGPNDTGLFAWLDPTQDRVAVFGIGFSDLGNPISVTLAGPADMIPEVANPDQNAAGISIKTVHRAFLNIAAVAGQSLAFTATFTSDLLSQTMATGYSPTVASGGGIWNSATWGGANWAFPAASTIYAAIPLSPTVTEGRVIQTQITESSQQEWILLGYELQVSARMPNL